ncbi:MAG: hypothetical protein ABIK15_19980 [Pseudomonadota bacterium]
MNECLSSYLSLIDETVKIPNSVTPVKTGQKPKLGDGRAAERIVELITAESATA